jgi:hypothetical protein
MIAVGSFPKLVDGVCRISFGHRGLDAVPRHHRGFAVLREVISIAGGSYLGSINKLRETTKGGGSYAFSNRSHRAL